MIEREVYSFHQIARLEYMVGNKTDVEYNHNEPWIVCKISLIVLRQDHFDYTMTESTQLDTRIIKSFATKHEAQDFLDRIQQDERWIPPIPSQPR